MRTFLVTALQAALVTGAMVSASMFAAEELSRSQPLVNPFAPYADIMPGQPREAVVAQGFHCQFYNPPFYTYDERCTLNSQSELFSEIEVSIDSDAGTIHKISFKLHQAVLTIGSLILLWGQPDVSRFGKNANLRWDHLHIVAVPQPHYDPYRYTLAITYVAFESSDE